MMSVFSEQRDSVNKHH